MLKATNDAVAIEMYKHELRNGLTEICLTAYFDRNTSTTRSIPEVVAKIALCGENIEVRTLESELSALRENEPLIKNWAAFLSDMLKGTTEVSFQILKCPSGRKLKVAKLGNQITIVYFDDKEDADIFFKPQTKNMDLVTVNKKEFLLAIREFLAEK